VAGSVDLPVEKLARLVGQLLALPVRELVRPARERLLLRYSRYPVLRE
jgi:hypothetical protein